MAAYDLDRATLDSLLVAENSDPHVRKAVIDFLVNQGTSQANALQFVGGLDGVAPGAGPTNLWSMVANAIATGELQWGGIGQFHDTLSGGSFDTLSGGDYGVQVGPSGASVVGTGADDTFLARMTGHDTIDGGAGYDHVVLNTTAANASVTTDQNGITTVTFSGGSVQVSNVEQLDFTDQVQKLP